MFRAHVLITRRSKLHYTASGIITPIGVMIPEAVHRLKTLHNLIHEATIYCIQYTFSGLTKCFQPNYRAHIFRNPFHLSSYVWNFS